MHVSTHTLYLSICLTHTHTHTMRHSGPCQWGVLGSRSEQAHTCWVGASGAPLGCNTACLDCVLYRSRFIWSPNSSTERSHQRCCDIISLLEETVTSCGCANYRLPRGARGGGRIRENDVVCGLSHGRVRGEGRKGDILKGR